MAALVVIAQLADLVTALTMPPHIRELNPLGAALLVEPLAAIAVKLALITLVLAVMAIAGRKRPGLARLVANIAILAGVIGAFSNT